MKAALITAYGGPEVLKIAYVPRPHPKADEVLVRISAAAINSIDWKISSGRFKHFMPVRQFPYIPGEEIAGVIEAKVPEFRRGCLSSRWSVDRVASTL